MAKKKLTKFFSEEMSLTSRYFYEHDADFDNEADEYQDERVNPNELDFTVFEVDHSLKRKMAKPELSIARWATTE